MEGQYLDDDERAAALIESNEAIIWALEKSTFMNFASKLETEDFNKAATSAFNSGDTTRLESLKELASYRGDEMGLKTISAQIEHLRENSLTPRQKLARAHQKRLNLHRELYDWGVNKILSGGDFQDLRGGDSDVLVGMEIAKLQKQVTENNE